jgi:hypothetical protein
MIVEFDTLREISEARTLSCERSGREVSHQTPYNPFMDKLQVLYPE